MNRILLKLWRIPVPGWVRLLAMWFGNPRFVATVVAIILNERGEVLLFRHTYRGRDPWGLPGGFLKRQEDPGLAVEREILEESGLVARSLRPLLISSDKDFPCLDVVVQARIVGGAFRPSAEVSEMRFFPVDQLPTLIPHARRLVEQALCNCQPE